MLCKHRNWGGIFEIEDIGKEHMLVKVVEHPKEWETMKVIGWRSPICLDKKEHEKYFNPIEG